jgi:hypothetical protein
MSSLACSLFFSVTFFCSEEAASLASSCYRGKKGGREEGRKGEVRMSKRVKRERERERPSSLRCVLLLLLRLGCSCWHGKPSGIRQRRSLSCD